MGSYWWWKRGGWTHDASTRLPASPGGEDVWGPDYSPISPKPEWPSKDAEVVWGGFASRGGSRYYIDMGSNAVTVQKFPAGTTDEIEWGVCLRFRRASFVDCEEFPSMASKWIQAAVKAAGKVKAAKIKTDVLLHEKRPALADFMTELEGPDGGEREPSCLMIAMTEDGVRAGLKDDDMGGWLWRSGDSVEECLDAIEKALQGPSPKFGGRPQRGQKGKKPRG